MPIIAYLVEYHHLHNQVPPILNLIIIGHPKIFHPILIRWMHNLCLEATSLFVSDDHGNNVVIDLFTIVN